MALLAAAVWAVLLASTGQLVDCFNLDQSENVIRFFTGGNEPNSLFGFSLAPYSFSDNHTSILVGAPNESGTNGTRTGAVYQCELGGGDNNCSRVVPFDSYTDQQVHKNIPNPRGDFPFVESHDDSKDAVDGQLLGYSIDAVNDYAIACAPHYSLTEESVSVEGELIDIPQYNGRCVILQQGENISTPYTQFPFINILGSYFGNTLRSFGTSVKLTSIDNRTELFSSSLLSGSSNHPFGRLYTLTVDPLPNSFIDSNNRLTDRGVNGYLGFHIEVGYVTIPKSSSDNPQVIASAPRDQIHKGSIYVWNDVYQDSVLELYGQETDGYFGYDFAVLSQTENDYDNLVVGCPLCSEEQGMVYYYGNVNGDLGNIALEIPAPNPNHKGRFGISVENIGDLDKDGYQDVAIAAPLEAGLRDDGTEYTGVVYIFRGISPTSIATEHSQVVYGYNSVPQFGYSLNGGRDLDDNTYPDLVIGGISTSSNSKIMLLRAAPVVTVEADIMAPRKPLVLNNLAEENVCIVERDTTVVCFNISACFNYSLLSGDLVERFKISYTLSSDSRVFTDQSDLNSGSTITKEFTITGEGTTYCDHHRVYLQPNIAQLTDLRFQLSIADSSEPLVLEDGLHPVLNVARPTEWSQLVELNSTCKDIICKPDLDLQVKYRGGETVYLNENFNLTFTITVTNNGVEDGFAFKVLIVLPYRGITKRDEVPYEKDSLLSSCVPSSTNSTVLECPIKSPIAADETISFDLILVPIVDDIPLNVSQLAFDFVCVDEQNADTDTTNNARHYDAFDVRSIAYYDTSISAGGTDPLVAHESNSRLNRFTQLTHIPVNTNDLGPPSPIKIIVRNDDDSELRNRNSPISSSEVFIFWPSQIAVQTSGDEVLFPFLVPLPRELQVQPPESTLCMYHDLFPSSLAPEDVANASFPSATIPPSEELYPDDCRKNIKCGVIICEASNLVPDGNVIDIFINSVLFSPSVTGNQEVNITVLVRNKDAYPKVNDTMTTLTLRVQTAVPEVAENCVDIYIPIVAAIGGFVVLVIIAMLLGFLGFFTRQNRFQRYLEESRGVHAFDDDESYAPRIVVPDHEYEANGEPQLISFGGRPPSCDASIRDDGRMSNGKMSPPPYAANGYRKENMVEGTETIQLATVRTDSSRTPTPHDGVFMEYTDSDIITTTSSQKSLDKQPNNVEHHVASPTVSVCSKETEI